MNLKRSLLLTSLFLIVATLVGLVGPRPALALDRTQTQQVMKSVVQFYAANKGKGKDGGFDLIWSGSGTIISKDGLILTNCHVACSDKQTGNPEDKFDTLLIGLTGRSDELPKFLYIGEVVQYSLRGSGLDLAVVRITKNIDGTPVDPTKLNLPALPIGDSDELEVNDPITIFGYPGIGGDTITVTGGKVSGFTRLQGIEGRAWIKTDATIAGGNSGGTAVNDKGELIGIPTQLGSGDPNAPYTDCRRLEDTNGDGTIDENDDCIPTGGFINAVRPVNLAKPYIEAAEKGLGPISTPDVPEPNTNPTGKATVNRIVFATGVNEDDQPTQVVPSFPSGTEEIFVFIDFDNWQPGTVWQVVLDLNGETYTDLWPAANWDGPASGTWWGSLSGQPLPDGDYEYTVYYDQQPIASAKTTVGGSAQTGATLSNIVFSGGGEEGYLLPEGINEIVATFDYANVSQSTKWSYTWYQDGTEVASDDGSAFSKTSGKFELSLTSEEGIPAGKYRLELFLSGKLAAYADLSLGGGGGGGGGNTGQFFSPIVFAEGADRNDNPVNPHKAGEPFASGATELYAFFDWQGMQDGWDYGLKWYLNDELVVDDSNPWAGGESGKNFWQQVNSENGLPDGTYRLELYVQGQLVQSGETVIGGGSGPTPTPTPTPTTDGVEVYGYIIDADTGKGIPGATFIVLQPGLTVQDFQWTDAEVYAIAQTDADGYYELSAPLVRGESYSIIVAAQGYMPIVQDAVPVDPNLESPSELDLQLQQQ